MGCVSLVRHKGNVKDSLSRSLDLIGGLGRYVSPNDRVLLKPNLNDAEGYTNITLTESLIQMLLDLRTKPFMAESTFGNANMTTRYSIKPAILTLPQSTKLTSSTLISHNP